MKTVTNQDFDCRSKAVRECQLGTAVIDTIDALVVVLDAEGRIVHFNPKCERTTGYASIEVEKQVYWEMFFFPEGVEAARKTFDWLKSGEYPIEEENSWKTRSGERRLIRWTHTVLPDSRGAAFYIVCTGIDVTEQRHAEEATLFPDENPDPVLRVHSSGVLLYMNASGAKNLAGLGLERGRIVPDVFSRPVGEALRDWQRKLVECEVGPRVFSFVLAPVAGKDYVNLYGRDTTEKKQAEEALRAHTLQVERLNRDMQDFLFIASHDLQEPLRKIRSFSDLLLVKYRGELGEEAAGYLSRMNSASVRMRQMIEDLLTYSRVTSKAIPFKRVSLKEIAAGVLVDLELRLEQTHGRVEIDDLPAIEADPAQMGHLIKNLIENGLKFHRPDLPPVVELYYETYGNRMSLFVKDNGIGFREEYLDKIFQPFQRLHARGEYEGTGMGLAICRKIVERHAGEITAQSQPGNGATFIVTLPLKQHYR